MKSHDEKFKELKMATKEGVERKWAKTLFRYKQHKTLGN
jgi:hypothetical protein